MCHGDSKGRDVRGGATLLRGVVIENGQRKGTRKIVQHL